MIAKHFLKDLIEEERRERLESLNDYLFDDEPIEWFIGHFESSLVFLEKLKKRIEKSEYGAFSFNAVIEMIYFSWIDVISECVSILINAMSKDAQKMESIRLYAKRYMLCAQDRVESVIDTINRECEIEMPISFTERGHMKISKFKEDNA
jgi:hypothetical protein